AAAGARRSGSPEAMAAHEDLQPVHVPGDRLGAIQSEYLQRLHELMQAGQTPEPQDRRFSGQAWQGPFAWTANLYLLNAEFMKRLAESVEGGNAKARERIRFATQQWIDAASPANFLLTNPEAQQRLVETRGESL